MRGGIGEHATTGAEVVVVAGLGFVVHPGRDALLLGAGLHDTVGSAVGYVVRTPSRRRSAVGGRLRRRMVVEPRPSRGVDLPGRGRRAPPRAGSAKRGDPRGGPGVNAIVLAGVVRVGVRGLSAQAVTTAIVAQRSYVISRRWAFAASLRASVGGVGQ